jgi:DNA-binding transcriptional LysR family regulator
MGLGYAWYPEQNIRDELREGTLRPLPLAEGAERYVSLYMVFADHDVAGPGVRRLAEVIRKRTAETCRSFVAPTVG